LPSNPHQTTTRGSVVGDRTYADPMVDHAETLSKAEAAGVLRRVGFSDEKIDKLLSELNDPIDFDRDAAILEKFGVNRDTLVDLMGGSP
jgi:CBS-domain-containing membrane protein